MNTRRVGAAHEKMAGAFLESRGLTILEYNFRGRCGEIDIVAEDKETTVFAEVKYRKDAGKGLPEEAVDHRKQGKICRAADHYRMLHRMGDLSPVRFDVVAICGEEIRWYPGAFEYIAGGAI